MNTRFSGTNIFLIAAIMLLVVSGPANATETGDYCDDDCTFDEDDYCEDRLESLRAKRDLFDQLYLQGGTSPETSEETVLRIRARGALFLQSERDWEFNCVEKVRCEEGFQDDYCNRVVSPSR